MKAKLQSIKQFFIKSHQKFYTFINFCGKKIAEHNINANAISILGFIIGIMAINFLAMQSYGLALICILVNRFFDILDGSIARHSKKTSDFGIFLDASLDYIFYAGIIFGFALANPVQNALAASFFLMSFCAAAAAMLAYGVIAYKKDSEIKLPLYLGGLFQAGEVAIALIIMCILPGLFMPIAILLGILSLIKAFSIIISAYYNFVIAPKK